MLPFCVGPIRGQGEQPRNAFPGGRMGAQEGRLCCAPVGHQYLFDPTSSLAVKLVERRSETLGIPCKDGCIQVCVILAGPRQREL